MTQKLHQARAGAGLRAGLRAPHLSGQQSLPRHPPLLSPSPGLSQLTLSPATRGTRVTFLTPEVREGHVLQGDLPQEVWALAPRVPCHNLPLPQPVAQPGQLAVAVEGIGQKVSGRGGLCDHRDTAFQRGRTHVSTNHGDPNIPRVCPLK